MKKLILSVIVIIITGCTSVYEIPRRDLTTLLDFRPYTEKGFLITTETYNGEYEPVGVVSYKIKPSCNNEGLMKSGIDLWVPNVVPTHELLDSLFVLCRNLGSNGIMNFWFENGESPSNTLQDIYTISAGGFAIIRK